MEKKRNISKIEPPRELCKRCREWLTQEDVGFNDIPHCCCEAKFEAHQYMIGMENECKNFNEW